MNDDDEEVTQMGRLLRSRYECDRGIEMAQACLAQEFLKPFEASYRNQQAMWLTVRDAVDRAIARLEMEQTNG